MSQFWPVFHIVQWCPVFPFSAILNVHTMSTMSLSVYSSIIDSFFSWKNGVRSAVNGSWDSSWIVEQGSKKFFSKKFWEKIVRGPWSFCARHNAILADFWPIFGQFWWIRLCRKIYWYHDSIFDKIEPDVFKLLAKNCLRQYANEIKNRIEDQWGKTRWFICLISQLFMVRLSCALDMILLKVTSLIS